MKFFLDFLFPKKKSLRVYMPYNHIDEIKDEGIKNKLNKLIVGHNRKRPFIFSVSVDENIEYHSYNDKPAVVSDGAKYWYKNGKLHRDDGPAVEWESGTRQWYKNGVLHRIDKPAIEWHDGTKEWWENGKKIKSNNDVVFIKV